MRVAARSSQDPRVARRALAREDAVAARRERAVPPFENRREVPEITEHVRGRDEVERLVVQRRVQEVAY